MTRLSTAERLLASQFDTDLETDVLVIGGSMAGAWAALTAADAGAKVLIVEKGWVGSAGVVAAATSAGYFVLPDNPKQRQWSIEMRHSEAGDLDDFDFIEGVLTDSYQGFKEMEQWGFRFGPKFGKMRGPDSMVFLRRELLRRNVVILDHSPALELLRDGDGVIAGATGVRRQRNQTWRVRAGAVVLATGGNAFRSGALGTNGCTGEGLLFAAEAGADFVGMEFSGHYMLTPLGSSCTKGGQYIWSKLIDDHGERLDTDLVFDQPLRVARALLQGRKVCAIIDKVSKDKEAELRLSMENFYVYFDRMNIDPFSTLWPVELRYEGTVRATGGVRIDAECGTAAPGLFAAGDVTERIRLTGAAMSGAGSALAWCLSSGKRAGAAAAKFARRHGGGQNFRELEGLGGAGLRPLRSSRASAAELLRSVQAEILPLEKNAFRHEIQLKRSLEALAATWSSAVEGIASLDAREALKSREVSAMAATGRWIYTAALERRETRGLHRRTDFPETDPNLRINFITGGLERPWVTASPLQSQAG